MFYKLKTNDTSYSDTDSVILHLCMELFQAAVTQAVGSDLLYGVHCKCQSFKILPSAAIEKMQSLKF